jgi:uncharacterized integral membrane protein
MLRILILSPFLLLLAAFAISNPQPVSLALWPTDVTLEAPLSIAVLIIAGVFFWLGALLVWFPALAARRRAAKAEKRAVKLEARLAAHTAAPKAEKLLPAPR